MHTCNTNSHKVHPNNMKVQAAIIPDEDKSTIKRERANMSDREEMTLEYKHSIETTVPSSVKFALNRKVSGPKVSQTDDIDTDSDISTTKYTSKRKLSNPNDIATETDDSDTQYIGIDNSEHGPRKKQPSNLELTESLSQSQDTGYRPCDYVYGSVTRINSSTQQAIKNKLLPKTVNRLGADADSKRDLVKIIRQDDEMVIEAFFLSDKNKPEHKKDDSSSNKQPGMGGLPSIVKCEAVTPLELRRERLYEQAIKCAALHPILTRCLSDRTSSSKCKLIRVEKPF